MSSYRANNPDALSRASYAPAPGRVWMMDLVIGQGVLVTARLVTIVYDTESVACPATNIVLNHIRAAKEDRAR